MGSDMDWTDVMSTSVSHVSRTFWVGSARAQCSSKGVNRDKSAWWEKPSLLLLLLLFVGVEEFSIAARILESNSRMGKRAGC